MKLSYWIARQPFKKKLFVGGALWFATSAMIGLGLYMDAEQGRIPWRQASLMALIFATGFVALLGVTLEASRTDRLAHTVYWLTDVVKAHVVKQRAEDESDQAKPEGDSALVRWPWGGHSTAHLEHLEAAARKWWTLYDPNDPTTAPTNDTVADWLQSERGVSKEKARAIASILRADGLPTGPRR